MLMKGEQSKRVPVAVLHGRFKRTLDLKELLEFHGPPESPATCRRH